MILVLVLGILALLLCGLVYIRMQQHSQALMNLGKPGREKSPYESRAEYEARGPREDQ